jgi:hypothetical protein
LLLFLFRGNDRQKDMKGYMHVQGGKLRLQGRGFDLDPALMILNDAEGNGQPQTGALADPLGGVKRIKNPAQLLRGNAGTGITDDDLDLSAFLMPAAPYPDDPFAADGTMGIRQQIDKALTTA